MRRSCAALSLLAIVFGSGIANALPSPECRGVKANYDRVAPKAARSMGFAAGKPKEWPVSLVWGVLLGLLSDDVAAATLRRQCYEEVAKMSGRTDLPPYNIIMGITQRHLPEKASWGWMVTDNGCQVMPWTVEPRMVAAWSGNCSGGMAQGAGELVLSWSGGSATFRGALAAGQATGEGTLISSDGARYDGGFLHGSPWGRGVLTYADGQRWEGEFAAGEPHGHAIYRDARGNRYEGEYSDGAPHGRGTTWYISGNRYDGEYANGKRNGRGVFTKADGERYDGEWRDDLRHGHGVLTSPTGSRFEVRFVDDNPVLR